MDTPLPEPPGVFDDLPPVDSCAYGGDPKDRGVVRPIIRGMYDVDPTPLARLLNASLTQGEDLLACMRQIADDDRDGPIHLVRLLAACDYAARKTGGTLTGPGGDNVSRMLTMTIAGGLPALAQTLREGGHAAATQAARAMDPETRYGVLDALLSYWRAPITALYMDLT